MDLHSESDSEDGAEVTAQASVEAEQQDQQDQQEAAAHPAGPTHPNEETGPARECGTPGCDLDDFHLGPCKTQEVTGPRQRQPRPSVRVQGEAGAQQTDEVGEAEAEAEAEAVEVVESEAEAEEAEAEAEAERTDAAQEALRQAEAEKLTLQPSTSTRRAKAGYAGVYHKEGDRSVKPFQAQVRQVKKRGGGMEYVHLGYFATAEEAALAVARAKAGTAAPSASPSLAMESQEIVVPPPIGVGPAAVPTPATPPTETLLQKVNRIKVALELDTTLLPANAIKVANERMGIAPGAGAGPSNAPLPTLPSQADTLIAAIGI